MHEALHRYADRTRDEEARRLAAAIHYPRPDWVLSWEAVLGREGSLVLLEVPEPRAHEIKYLLVWREPGGALHRLVETDAARVPHVATGAEAALSALPDKIRDALGLGALVESLPSEATPGAPDATSMLLSAVREAVLGLTPEERRDLLRGGLQSEDQDAVSRAAAEVLYHLIGGKEAGAQPAFLQHEGRPHWFVRGAQGEPLDPVGEHQFRTPVPHHRARPQPLLGGGGPLVERLRVDAKRLLQIAKKSAKESIREGKRRAVAPLGPEMTKAGWRTLGMTVPGMAPFAVVGETAADLQGRKPARQPGETTAAEDFAALVKGKKGGEKTGAATEKLSALAPLSHVDCAGSFFHVTPYDRMNAIAVEGLETGHGGQWGGGYAQHSRGRVFLAKGLDAAKGWFHATLHAALGNTDLNSAEDLEQVVPVMLRVHVPEGEVEIDQRGSERVMCSFFLPHGVQPDDIEFWCPCKHAWMPIAMWPDPGPKHGVQGGEVTFQQDEETGEERLSDYVDVLDSWEDGGFKPSTEEEAEAPGQGGSINEPRIAERLGRPTGQSDHDARVAYEKQYNEEIRPLAEVVHVATAVSKAPNFLITVRVLAGSMGGQERQFWANASEWVPQAKESRAYTPEVGDRVRVLDWGKPGLRAQGGAHGSVQKYPWSWTPQVERLTEHEYLRRTDVDPDTLTTHDVLTGDGPDLDAWERTSDTWAVQETEHKRPSVVKASRWARPSKVQTLLFARERWTEGKAKKWAKAHGFKIGKVHVTDNYIRFRQADPTTFRGLRTIDFGDFERNGIRAVVGEPPPGW